MVLCLQIPFEKRYKTGDRSHAPGYSIIEVFCVNQLPFNEYSVAMNSVQHDLKEGIGC